MARGADALWGGGLLVRAHCLSSYALQRRPAPSAVTSPVSASATPTALGGGTSIVPSPSAPSPGPSPAYRNDQTRVLPVNVTSIDWVGWLDNGHLVTGLYQAFDGSPSVVDLGSNAVTPIDARGIVAAIFPSNLEP